MMNKSTGKRLFVITNLWVFLEECSVIEEGDGMTNYGYFSPLYPVDCDAAAEKIRALMPGIIFCDLPALQYWDTIISPSGIGNGTLFDFDATQYVLVEEGLSDYAVPADEMFSKVIRSRCSIYTWHKLPCKTEALYLSAGILPVNQSIFRQGMDLFREDIEKAKQYDIIFLTDPLDCDFGLDIGDVVKKIERDYPWQKILVKPHPRDTYQYRSDIVKFETISTETPAELILYCLLASGKIPEVIYDYPTSAAMHTGVKGKLYRLPSDNRQYNDLMDRYSRQISSIQQTEFIRKTA